MAATPDTFIREGYISVTFQTPANFLNYVDYWHGKAKCVFGSGNRLILTNKTRSYFYNLKPSTTSL